MPRAIWTGTVGFGLVEIPVSLVSAENVHEEVKFRLLDRRTMKPVGYSRVNKATGAEVPWTEVVRGYECEKDEYVVLSDAELHAADLKKSESIDIVGFVELSEIDAFHFDKPYYLVPTKKPGKGYALLRETLERTGRAGIAQIVLHTRQHLAAVTTRGPALALVLLRYADEIREPKSLDLPESATKSGGVKDREIELAARLVEQMAMKWAPEKFEDAYRKDVMALIEKKIKSGKTEEIVSDKRARGQERRGDLLDLMPLLKKSIEAGPRRARTAAPKRRARKGA